MQLREIFEPYGEVTESDVIGGYGFVHMASEQQAMEAIKDLNGFKLNGNLLNVALSTRDTQGKARGQDGFVVGDRGRGGMMPWGPARGRGGRGVLGSRFDPYSAPPLPGNSWFPRSDQYVSPGAGVHMMEPSPTVDVYRNPGVLHAPPPPAGVHRPGLSGDDSSFARELLQLYTQDPMAFDAYARNPQVRRSLNLEPEPPVLAMRQRGDDLYLKPPRDYLPDHRIAPATRMVQPGVMVPSYGRGVAPMQQAVSHLPMPSGTLQAVRPTQLYMSFE
jgi:hypothetical protein